MTPTPSAPASRPERDAPACSACSQAPASVCRECVRAVALMFFGGIARHPEQGAGCALCEAGEPEYCGNCFVAASVEQRTLLREHAGYTGANAISVGRDIG